MKRLKRYLDEEGLSQTEFGLSVGVKQPTIWGWINGTRSPSIENLKTLSHITGLTIDELLDHKPSRSNRGQHNNRNST
jgi:transcriptional regulator with XRE-family HTH domain